MSAADTAGYGDPAVSSHSRHAGDLVVGGELAVPMLHSAVRGFADGHAGAGVPAPGHVGDG